MFISLQCMQNKGKDIYWWAIAGASKIV